MSAPTIIVPFRDSGDGVRAAQLHDFLEHMKSQRPTMRVLVVQQPSDGRKFNRGALLNCGAAYAKKHFPGSTHYIFHDVDLLMSEDLFRRYWDVPAKDEWLHFGACWKRYDSASYFGGIVAVRPQTFFAVHGFSNLFFGWGGEDDDLRRRVFGARHHIRRFSAYDGHIKDAEGLSLDEKLQTLRENPQDKCLTKWETAAESHRLGATRDGVTTLAFKVTAETVNPESMTHVITVTF